jgi:hypothetical protein
MAVAGVAVDVPELHQAVERAAKRLAADAEATLQLDESRPAALAEQRKRRRRPAVVEQVDQVFG